MTSIKDFRKSLSKIIPKTINKQLELGFEDEKSPYEIYNSYLKNDYEIEPLSYFTIFKIWKISKFLQDKFEIEVSLFKDKYWRALSKFTG
jgi:hypothetical protein